MHVGGEGLTSCHAFQLYLVNPTMAIPTLETFSMILTSLVNISNF